jgi:poly(A) polymerase
VSGRFSEIAATVLGRSEEAYFVGGCVRDLLRGEPIKDLDLVLRGDTHEVGRRLAREHEGHVFWLREEGEVVRVLLPRLEGLQIDLTPLKGSLEEDLRARDLTINAMAIPAGAGLDAGAVLDSCGGAADLAAGVIRFVTPEAPERDPLRTLRALRFRWKLGFVFGPETERRLAACVPLLARVSTERIRDELFHLLAIPEAAAALEECLAFGMLRWLVGTELEAELHAPAARVRAVQALLEAPTPELARLLGEQTSPPRRRREVLLWAAALQPLCPPLDPAAAARHLALSGDERTLITRAFGNAGVASELAERWPAAGRHLRRLNLKAKPAGPEAVLLAAADRWSAAYAELLVDQLQRHFFPEPPLLTGIEVMQILAIPEGPGIGRAIEEVEEARADGLLRSREEAAEWLRQKKAGVS